MIALRALSFRVFVLGGIVAWLAASAVASAHCDTMQGPVVADAKTALEKQDVSRVLKWVKEDDEEEVRTAFHETLAVRAKGPDARELADMYFFETLVRLHRAGEGAPYTGLKISEPEPIIKASDKALETGSVDALVKDINDATAAGIRQRYTRVLKTAKHKDESVEAGRQYVEAYVEFTHYVERLHAAAVSDAHKSEEETAVQVHFEH